MVRAAEVRPPHLPYQTPRRPDEHSPLTGAGAKIVRPAHGKAAAQPPQQQQPHSARRAFVPTGVPPSPLTSTSASKASQQPERPAGDEVMRAWVNEAARPAAGGDARWGLAQQVEAQAQELAKLKEFSRSQQQRLREYEKQAEQSQADAVEQARAEAAEAEARLRREMQAQMEELLERAHTAEGVGRQFQGERDEARANARELQEKLASAVTVDTTDAKVNALDMELGLVRARLHREEQARRAAEQKAQEATLQEGFARHSLDQSLEALRDMQQALAEVNSVAEFRKEVCEDLQAKVREAQQARRPERKRGEAALLRHGVENSDIKNMMPKHLMV